MSNSDRIGIEIFSFQNMKTDKTEFSPFKTVLFHFSVQEPNIEELVAKIVEHGGKQRMPISEYYPNEKL